MSKSFWVKYFQALYYSFVTPESHSHVSIDHSCLSVSCASRFNQFSDRSVYSMQAVLASSVQPVSFDLDSLISIVIIVSVVSVFVK